MSLTADQFKAVLKGAENKRADKALAIITDVEADPQDLLALLPLPACKYERGRKRGTYKAVWLLDACYAFDEVVAKVTEETTENGIGITKATIGPAEDHATKLIRHCQVCFRILLANGVTEGGSNNWRSALFPHILRSAIQHPEQGWRLEFALLLISLKPEMRDGLATAYHGFGRPDKYAVLLALGLSPVSPAALWEALNYVHCSPNSGDTDASKLEVITRMFEALEVNETRLPGLFLVSFLLDHPESAIKLDVMAPYMLGWLEDMCRGWFKCLPEALKGCQTSQELLAPHLAWQAFCDSPDPWSEDKQEQREKLLEAKAAMENAGRELRPAFRIMQEGWA